MKRDDSNLYAPLRELKKPAMPSPESAMRWPYALLLLVLLSVALGAAVAFAIENWPAIKAASNFSF